MPKSRILTIDIARGFIVLIMPAVHVTLFYSNDEVKDGLLGFFLRCLAEGPGAQLFMFLMGFSIVLARKKTPQFILRRSIVLFCAAYLLNFIKFILPALFGFLPVELLSDNGISNDFFGYLDLLFVGDILQFAGIAYLLCGTLYLWKFGFYAAGILGSFIILFSPVFWGHRAHIIIVDLFIRLFNGLPPAEFFPFFPWGAYPLLGLFAGYAFLRLGTSTFYHLLTKIGACLVVVGWIISVFEPKSYNANFYRLGPGGTFFHLGIVLLWIRLCNELGNRKPWSKFVFLLCYLSRRITSVYIIQWTLICWLLTFFGLNDSNLIETCFEIIGISLLTFLGVFIIERISKRRNSMNVLKI